MLTGDAPLLSMARNMPGILKKIALLLFGPFFVPNIEFKEAFLV
jgi:hypothetical protein